MVLLGENGKERLPGPIDLTLQTQEGVISMGPVRSGAQRRKLRVANHPAPIQVPPVGEGP